MTKAIILGPAHPLRGGIAAFNERLALELTKQSINTTIYSFSLQYPSFLFPGTTQYSTESAPAGIDINTCVNSVNPLNWLKVGRMIRDEKPDVLIVRFWIPFMSPALGTIIRQAKRNKNIRVIAIIDNIIPHEKRVGDKLLSQYFVNSIDGFITMSQVVNDELALFDNKKPRIITPHPLYDHFGLLESKANAIRKLDIDNNTYVLFFGLIRDYKGLDLVLEAFLLDKLRKLNVKLIVAGEFYNNKEKYEPMIRKLEQENRIVMHEGFVPDSKVSSYFNSADLVVQPYKSATQSGVTQIAYHFEKAMIVTDVGGLPQMCPDGEVGYVVNTTSDAVADGIYRYFTQADKRLMLENIKREKKKYSWQKFVSNTVELYKSIK